MSNPFEEVRKGYKKDVDIAHVWLNKKFHRRLQKAEGEHIRRVKSLDQQFEDGTATIDTLRNKNEHLEISVSCYRWTTLVLTFITALGLLIIIKAL